MLTEQIVELSKSDVPALLNVAFKLVDYITQGWNAFVVLSGVMIGWRFSAKDQWSKTQKILVTGLYSLFAVLNFMSLYVSYSWLRDIMADLKTAGNALSSQTPQLKGHLTNLYLVGGMKWVTVIYVLGLSLVICCLWFVRYPTKAQ